MSIEWLTEDTPDFGGYNLDSDSRAPEDCQDLWNETWRPLLSGADGEVDLERVKCELFDYWSLLMEVPKVYCHVTNGRLSKPNYPAETIISVVDELQMGAEAEVDALCDLVSTLLAVMPAEQLRELPDDADVIAFRESYPDLIDEWCWRELEYLG